MSDSVYVVASKFNWNDPGTLNNLSKKYKGDWHYVFDQHSLETLLKNINPRYIFFTHWSWIIPKEIVTRYECVCFHMTDLPFGRGGSPLQNLIVRGYKYTVLSALRMEEEVDSGPIYYKKELSIHGAAYDIYKRVEALCWEMIGDFVRDNPQPKPQVGVAVNFKRRLPSQSRIPEDASLENVYDYIRMLDAPGYPRAFLEMEGYRLEFENADLIDGKLSATVNFIKK